VQLALLMLQLPTYMNLSNSMKSHSLLSPEELHLRSSDTLCAALALADWPACVRLCLHQAVLGPQPHQDGGALAAVGNPASQQNAKYVRPGCQHDPVARHLRAGLALAWFTQRCARLHAVYLGHQLSKLRLDCLRAAHTAVCDQR